MKKKLIIIAVIIVLIIVGIFVKRTAIREFFYNRQKEPIPEEVTLDDLKLQNNSDTVANANLNINGNVNLPVNKNGNQNITQPVNQNNNVNTNQPVGISDLSGTFNLSVSFTSQAPFSNWEMPYQEACEETAMLTVDFYWQKKTFTPTIADQEILKIVDWEAANNWPIDLTVAQMAQAAKDYLGYKNVEIINNPTMEMIKQRIHQGQPVIVPTAGRELGNPNYTAPGPLYHMLVIKGWTANNFITNDSGTRKGKDYQYKYATLMSAIHDWNNGDVPNGQSVMLIIK
jgi:hypothetical protein